MSNTTQHYLFLTTSTRESGHLGNTEWLAQQAAAALPAGEARRDICTLKDDIFGFGSCFA